MKNIRLIGDLNMINTQICTIYTISFELNTYFKWNKMWQLTIEIIYIKVYVMTPHN